MVGSQCGTSWKVLICSILASSSHMLRVSLRRPFPSFREHRIDASVLQRLGEASFVLLEQRLAFIDRGVAT